MEEKTFKPKVSVVMPHYNQAHLISNAINSIKNQTLENWELIIVDDGSDNLIELQKIIRNFNDDRIKVILLEHYGLVNARNNGCEIAKAEIIATQDADDLSMPDRLEKCVKLIESGWDIICHGAYINMWDAQFNCISRKYIHGEKAKKERILKGQYLTGWPVFKKKVWELKPFRLETQYAYDWMMWLDWIYSDFKIYSLDEGLYEYVRQEDSASIQFEKDGRRKQSIEAIALTMKKEYNVDICLNPKKDIKDIG